MHDPYYVTEVSPDTAAEFDLAEIEFDLAEIAYEDRFAEGYEPDFYEDGPRAYAH